MSYDINEGNIYFKDDKDDIITPSDPDSDIPDNTEETGFRYNNYGTTMYATSEDEPDKDDCPACDQDDEESDNDDCPVCDDEELEDDDDSEEYNDNFIEL